MQTYTQGDSHSGELWLQLKKELNAIRSREELAYVINERIKVLFPVSHALAIIFEEADGFRRHMLNQLPTLHRDSLVPRFEGRRKDAFIGLARRSDAPTLFEMAVLSAQITLPPYLSANVRAGIQHIMVSEIGISSPAGVIVVFLDPDRPFMRRMENDLKDLAHELGEVAGRLYAPETPANETNYRLLIESCNRMATVTSASAFKSVLQDICLHGFGRKEFMMWVPSADETGFVVAAEGIILKGTSKRLYDRAVAMLGKELAKLTKKRGKDPFAVSFHAFADALSGVVGGDMAQWMRTGTLLHLPMVSDADTEGYIWIFADKHDTDFGMAVASLVKMAWRNLHSQNAILQTNSIHAGKGKRDLNLGADSPVLTVSSSGEMNDISEQLLKVAPTDLTILLLGETGTGKNLVANAIHQQSARWQMPFVTVNCAAISPEMWESELFGHEPGSYTGAVDRRIGKFEQANGGTLFLDEIGEVPFAMQVKLLRAIQEKEIERLGGSSPIPVDIRIIAATNRDIQAEVQQGRFRRDLFFRVNGFSIRIPPLRERTADIPGLISHFLEKFGRRHAKTLPRLSQEMLSVLTAYDWPGNVRQLEYLMEKIVILSSERLVHETIRAELRATAKPADSVKTLAEVEKDHILSILAISSGKISGPGGAAELLQLPPTTLKSKIKKLGIRKRFYQ